MNDRRRSGQGGHCWPGSGSRPASLAVHRPAQRDRRLRRAARRVGHRRTSSRWLTASRSATSSARTSGASRSPARRPWPTPLEAQRRELPGSRRARLTGSPAIPPDRPRRLRTSARPRQAMDPTRSTAVDLLRRDERGDHHRRGSGPGLSRPDRPALEPAIHAFLHRDAEVALDRPASRRQAPGRRSRSVPWPACRSRSRTCSAPRGCRRPAPARCSRTSGPRTTPR